MESMIVTIVLSILAIAGALYALSARELMRGVLGLALFFMCIAGFFALLGATYLAVGQLFLFVGGVVTLFVLAFNAHRTPVQRRSGIAGVFICIAALSGMTLFLPGPATTQMTTTGTTAVTTTVTSGISVSAQDLALQFFSHYGWALNILLLVLFSALMTAQYLLEDD